MCSLHKHIQEITIKTQLTSLQVADHDIEDPNLTQIIIYAGRGLLSTSVTGTISLFGTSVEHHDLYQYQFVNTKNTFMGVIQSETAYWQPNPKAGVATPVIGSWNDPDFATSCAGVSGNCASGWGLGVVNSQSILVYGAGLYSFFQNNNNSKCFALFYLLDANFSQRILRPGLEARVN